MPHYVAQTTLLYFNCKGLMMYQEKYTKDVENCINCSLDNYTLPTLFGINCILLRHELKSILLPTHRLKVIIFLPWLISSNFLSRGFFLF